LLNLNEIKEPIYPSVRSRVMARGLLHEQFFTSGK